MREGPGNNVFAMGPLPRPDSTIVTSWKWVWRGLDPETRRFPSPIYQELLKGRVRRADSQPEGSALPLETRLATARRRRGKAPKKQRTGSCSMKEGWTYHSVKPKVWGGTQGPPQPFNPDEFDLISTENEQQLPTERPRKDQIVFCVVRCSTSLFVSLHFLNLTPSLRFIYIHPAVICCCKSCTFHFLEQF